MTEGSDTTNASNGLPIPRDSTGIYEDLPGLNPTDERVVEYQAAIREEMGRLMINRDPNDNDVMAAAERIHGESNNIEFLRGQLFDLKTYGIRSEAFQIGVPNDAGLPGGGNPAGSSGGGNPAGSSGGVDLANGDSAAANIRFVLAWLKEMLLLDGMLPFRGAMILLSGIIEGTD
ncbi:hypothetical protein GUJ93_ZPchr0495g2771 [Zizania palustris]|uniref:Uncharacterized protein n=1 Tax=Zizania palustris TaxID=103762 RepID=A0A8J5V342_ZIZPA|nr:hypothetical protein GUJ93_ZPchr0495g2771 [Zizania palustris]